MTERDTIRKLLDKGLTHFGLGQVEQALEAWNQVLKMQPDNLKAKQYIDFARTNRQPHKGMEVKYIRSDKSQRSQGPEDRQSNDQQETKIGSSSLPSYPQIDEPQQKSSTPLEVLSEFESFERNLENQPTTPDAIDDSSSHQESAEIQHLNMQSEEFWNTENPNNDSQQEHQDIWVPLNAEDIRGLTLSPSPEEDTHNVEADDLTLDVEEDTHGVEADDLTLDIEEDTHNVEADGLTLDIEEDTHGVETNGLTLDIEVVENKDVKEASPDEQDGDNMETVETSLEEQNTEGMETAEVILDIVADNLDTKPLDSEIQSQSSSDTILGKEAEARLKGARELLEMDDFTNALELAEKVLSQNPTHPEAFSIKQEAEKSLISLLSAKLGELQRVPVVAMKDDEIIWLNLDHRAGFILSLVDGQTTLDEILSLSNLRSLDAMRILTQLLQDNIIKLT